MGDAVCAMAAVQEIERSLYARSAEPRKIFIQPENDEIAMLMVPHLQRLKNFVGFVGESDLMVLSIGYAFSHYGYYAHPIKLFLDQAKVPCNELPPMQYKINPTIYPATGQVVYDEIPAPYDFLISPWARGGERAMPVQMIYNLMSVLDQTYPGCRIGILGGVGDPQLTFRSGAPFDYVYGYYVENLIRIMQQAKCVITTDSGPSRVAHLINLKQHVLVYNSEVYPKVWVNRPGVALVGGMPQTWNIGRILQAIGKVKV
jgi:hypothetical protein